MGFFIKLWERRVGAVFSANSHVSQYSKKHSSSYVLRLLRLLTLSGIVLPLHKPATGSNPIREGRTVSMIYLDKGTIDWLLNFLI